MEGKDLWTGGVETRTPSNSILVLRLSELDFMTAIRQSAGFRVQCRTEWFIHVVNSMLLSSPLYRCGSVEAVLRR